MVDEATRIRVIRSLTGLSNGEFAKVVGVNRASVTNWERGYSVPQRDSRKALAQLCSENGIEFREDGMPVPVSE